MTSSPPDIEQEVIRDIARLAADPALAGPKQRGALRAALQGALERLPGGVPLAEYPRPQFVRRGDWRNLNGLWTACFDSYHQAHEGRWQDGELPRDFPIVVPFAFQWPASGIGKRALEERLWYERELEIPAAWLEQTRDGNYDVLLHFEAVDYRCTIYLNGQAVGHHQGGHVPFQFDVTPFLKGARNRLHVAVEDRQDACQPRGKQSANGLSESCDYTNTSGIWQTVWLELAPAERIETLRFTPQVAGEEDDALEIEVLLHAAAGGWRVSIEVFDGLLPQTSSDDSEPPPLVAQTMLRAPLSVESGRIALPHARRWSPHSPHLYGVRARLLDECDTVRDEVLSYAAIRAIGLQEGQFLLNGEPLYLKMVLDQGYWPLSGMTAPGDAALCADVAWAKAFGFNGVRKHQKIEARRWLHHCDRMGMLVWGEMANARARSPQSEEWFLAEWEAAVRRDYNAPCIVTWVPINETWGLPSLREQEHPAEYAFVEKVVALTRRLDATRLVVDNDGWQHTDVADLVTVHDYSKTGAALTDNWQQTLHSGTLPERLSKSGYKLFARSAKYRGQPILFSEVGGFFTLPRGVSKSATPEKWDAIYDVYGALESEEDLEARYRDLMQGIAALKFACGFCYTQLTDIEQEVNGLLTFDRQPKVAPAAIAAIHRMLFEPTA